ncbi:hypothetical protein SAMN04489859_1006103 [Paracoccus alcaliphilus]|uniref:Uncharacterized protein n=1 Tax=Paracoccus alcaliphilus TaxID=34002 RepID=A0A1H8GBH1_9RHOB|nr:hypothetical protein [Paracoccus alcaliphilus]WCR17936.1 hypothetical protein JHW40_16835 [Paracoccus alcaliphilus]SEN41352.1 hypothetical protein SAMN04489859_1006103 [Paracoccus alcaliphilus]
MKLSDMFSTLAENARAFEERASEWQKDLTARNEEMIGNVRKWQDAALERQDEMNRQMRGYFDEAGENVRKQWETMHSAWEDQFEKMKARGEEMRVAAGKMQGGDFADWAEAYAAQMVSYAQKMQDEAANAIASATEARAKSPGKKKG